MFLRSGESKGWTNSLKCFLDFKIASDISIIIFSNSFLFKFSNAK